MTCVLGDDSDLRVLGRQLSGPVGAVVIGNALHWMDETAALERCAHLLRPGGRPPAKTTRVGWRQPSAVLRDHGSALMEEVTTTAVIGRRLR